MIGPPWCRIGGDCHFLNLNCRSAGRLPRPWSSRDCTRRGPTRSGCYWGTRTHTRSSDSRLNSSFHNSHHHHSCSRYGDGGSDGSGTTYTSGTCGTRYKMPGWTRSHNQSPL